MRLSTLLWRDEDRTEAEIAHLLGICTRTVRNWLCLYRKNGPDTLCTLHYQGDRGALTASQAEQLRNEIQTGRFRCARQVREWIQVSFTIAYSLSGTKWLLQCLGCNFHKATGFLFKAQRDQQEEFVRKGEADRPAEGAATRRYFVDACHPVWGLELIYSGWLLRGQRLLVGVGGGRKRLSILGAYSPQDQESGLSQFGRRPPAGRGTGGSGRAARRGDGGPGQGGAGTRPAETTPDRVKEAAGVRRRGPSS